MPLIRVECDNEDFYKTVNWQDGKNPFAVNNPVEKPCVYLLIFCG